MNVSDLSKTEWRYTIEDLEESTKNTGGLNDSPSVVGSYNKTFATKEKLRNLKNTA